MPQQPSRSLEPRIRLGRGLAALLGDAAPNADAVEAHEGVKRVPIEFLRSNVRNPRQHFEQANLEELAESIKERGILQPILVRPLSEADDTFEIVAGERRWRAAQQVGLHTVPVIVLNVGDREALEIAIVENVQRADLNAIEEALGYSRLADDFGYNHADIARVVGKSRSHVANTFRLLNLPTRSRQLLSDGAITAGHARALLALPDPDAVANKIVSQGLTVRAVEKFGKKSAVARRSSKTDKIHDDIDINALQRKIALGLGIQVEIKRAGGRFELQLKARDVDQLSFICAKLLHE